jgi:hypothetical protein
MSNDDAKSVIVKFIGPWKIYYNYESDCDLTYCKIVINKKLDDTNHLNIEIRYCLFSDELVAKLLHVQQYATKDIIRSFTPDDIRSIVINAFVRDNLVKITYGSKHKLRYILYNNDYRFEYRELHLIFYNFKTFAIFERKLASGCFTTFQQNKLLDIQANMGENLQQRFYAIIKELNDKHRHTLDYISCIDPFPTGILKIIRDYVIHPIELLKLQLADIPV